MINRKAFKISAAVVAVALASVACSSSGGTKSGTSSKAGGTAPKSSIKLGGVAANAQDPYWVTLMCGGTKEAKAEGVSITWKAANNTDTSAAQANFQATTLQNPDGLVVASFQPGTFATQIKTLMAKGTPVVAVNSPITPATEMQLIQSATDNSAFAKLVSSSIGASGTLGILGGAPGIPAVTARWQPVVAALKSSAPGIKVLSTQYDDFDRNKATTAASAMITAHSDLKAIYASSGPEGEGAAAAVQQANKTGQIKVYSYDATPQEVTGLKSGAITALLAQPAANQGAEAVKALVSYLKGRTGKAAVQPVSPLTKLIPLKILTKDNLGDASSQGYQYKSTC